VRRTSELAHARLPESLHGNIERATAIVLNGGVVYDEDGKHAMVRASNGQTWYPVNGHCTCMGAPHAPEGLCKHALAARIYLRAGDLMREGLSAQTPAPDAPAPRPRAPRDVEAPFSATFKGHIGGVEVLLTARGCTFEAFAANVAAVRALLDAPSQAAPAPAPGQPTPEGWCLIHNTQMARQSNERGSWWSHKTADGWCRGKARQA
jgi:hypothetical protein